MAIVGYARVSSTGQSLDVQLDKLTRANCERVFKEKKSGTNTVNRPEFKACMSYLREGDTLVITRLDRLARSVLHLAEVAKKLESEGINLLVIDQSIDTSTSTGRLMFNMLASVAEFENDLRRERQIDGIAKAKEKGVKFGAPVKADDKLKHQIYARQQEGASISQLIKEFELSRATIMRSLRFVKSQSEAA